MTYLLLAIIILVVLSAVITRSRTAQLKRMARTLNLRYDTQVDSVLPPDSSARAQFFKHNLHQFHQVLTFQEPEAFVRVCEDRIVSSPMDKKPLHTYTLVAAELTNGTFTPFVLMPHTQEQKPGTNLPPELAAHYTLSAPEGFTLPPLVIGFLKSHPACYVECTPTALLYCEFNIVPVAQLQPLRFRAQQLLKALTPKPQPAPAAKAAAPLSKLTDEDLQSQILLKLQSAPRPTTQPAGNGRSVYAIILLALLGTLLLMAWYLMHYVVAR